MGSREPVARFLELAVLGTPHTQLQELEKTMFRQSVCNIHPSSRHIVLVILLWIDDGLTHIGRSRKMQNGTDIMLGECVKDDRRVLTSPLMRGPPTNEAFVASAQIVQCNG